MELRELVNLIPSLDQITFVVVGAGVMSVCLLHGVVKSVSRSLSRMRMLRSKAQRRFGK